MSKTILCADDSATMQKVAEITFGGSDYKYVGARSADEAVKLARSERPALILADAIMPGKTGYDLCKAIKSDPDLASIPVLLMCGNSQAYDNARGEQSGADGHVVKPWDTQVLLDKVAETLGRVATEGVAKLGAGAVAAAAAAPAAAARPAAAAASKPAAQPAAAAKVNVPSVPPAGNSGKAPSRPATPPPEPPRSATIMGMPTFTMPPGSGGKDMPPGVTPMASSPGGAAPTASASAGAGAGRAPMIKGQPRRGLRLVPINEVAAQVASEAGLDPAGPEMQALLKLSREVVERIVWEVVPDLAEAIIKQNLDKLTARAR
ncbi:MAG TPA: response regulator [Kofleriaceae bacterium]|nr:response regulator [Kofleriaceae bacterium]